MNYEFLSRLILSRITESAEKRCIEENIKLTFYFTFQLYDPTRIPESVSFVFLNVVYVCVARAYGVPGTCRVMCRMEC